MVTDVIPTNIEQTDLLWEINVYKIELVGKKEGEVKSKAEASVYKVHDRKKKKEKQEQLVLCVLRS